VYKAESNKRLTGNSSVTQQRRQNDPPTYSVIQSRYKKWKEEKCKSVSVELFIF